MNKEPKYFLTVKWVSIEGKEMEVTTLAQDGKELIDRVKDIEKAS